MTGGAIAGNQGPTAAACGVGARVHGHVCLVFGRMEARWLRGVARARACVRGTRVTPRTRAQAGGLPRVLEGPHAQPVARVPAVRCHVCGVRGSEAGAKHRRCLVVAVGWGSSAGHMPSICCVALRRSGVLHAVFDVEYLFSVRDCSQDSRRAGLWRPCDGWRLRAMCASHNSNCLCCCRAARKYKYQYKYSGDTGQTCARLVPVNIPAQSEKNIRNGW